MRVLFRRLTVLTCLALAASCAPATGANETSPRRDSNLITRDQLTARSFANVYDAVQTLNSNWLVLRGPDSINSPSQILVYLDENKMGGVETLRTINVADVTWIRRIDAVAATSRWGLGHGSGVIQVSTRQR